VASKLIVVKSLAVAEALRPHVPDFDVTTIGSALAGVGYDMIFIAFEPLTKREGEWAELLRNHLSPNGTFIS
jgi:hypothetical protein